MNRCESNKYLNQIQGQGMFPSYFGRFNIKKCWCKCGTEEADENHCLKDGANFLALRKLLGLERLVFIPNENWVLHLKLVLNLIKFMEYINLNVDHAFFKDQPGQELDDSSNNYDSFCFGKTRFSVII